MTITSGVWMPVEHWTPRRLNRSSSMASMAVMITGMCSGRQPAMTALVAIRSTVALPPRGGTSPMTSSASPRVYSTNRRTRSAAGGTTGRPSVQPDSNINSIASETDCVTITVIQMNQAGIPALLEARIYKGDQWECKSAHWACQREPCAGDVTGASERGDAAVSWPAYRPGKRLPVARRKCGRSDVVTLGGQDDHFQNFVTGNGPNELAGFPVRHREYSERSFRHSLQRILHEFFGVDIRRVLAQYAAKRCALPLTAGKVAQHAQ